MVQRFLSVLGGLILIFSGTASGQPMSTEHIPDSEIPQRTNNFYLLGKVWGYLKYHHPQVKGGCFDWDKELLSVAASINEAKTRSAALNVLTTWVRQVDQPRPDCELELAKREPSKLGERSWIQDEVLLGPDLAQALMAVNARAEQYAGQHYVTLVEGIKNPQFLTERSYAGKKELGWPYRLLALFRFWNIVEYWSPYKNVISQDWDQTLIEFIPRFIDADDEGKYVTELMVLVARVEDGHTALWSHFHLSPPGGRLYVHAHIRSIEGRPVVWRASKNGFRKGLAVGDVILTIDGAPVERLVDAWRPFYGASNESALRRQLYLNLLRGTEKFVDVRVERNGREVDLTLKRKRGPTRMNTHDRDGKTLQLLSEDVAYLKLSSVSAKDVPKYLEKIDGTRGLVIDIRNYPADFVVFALGQHLVQQTTPFARFTYGDLAAPGNFLWTDSMNLGPKTPFYDGKVVIIVDEASQSNSEYTAMAFRAGLNAAVVGSQTAGADGNVSSITLPGGYETKISGIGVFYPDRSPTQKIGIVADVAVRPTIAGIRAGRDEVLEQAVKVILGEEVSQGKLEELIRLSQARP